MIFAVFAVVQWNDPDAFVWIFVYGLPCLWFLMVALSYTALKVVNFGALGGAVLFGAVFFVFALQVSSWEMVSESAREAGGVGVIAASFAGLWLFTKEFRLQR